MAALALSIWPGVFGLLEFGVVVDGVVVDGVDPGGPGGPVGLVPGGYVLGDPIGPS